MKVLLVSNTTWNIYNFRMNLAAALRDAGYEVVAVGCADGYEKKVREEGYEWAEWKITRRSLNPFNELFAINNLRRVYAAQRPDVVQHFTVKPVLYGTLAAKLAGVPATVNSITGLPYMLTSKPNRGWGGFAKWCSLSWYAHCCAGKGRKSLFQNKDDLEMLLDYNSKIEGNAIVTPGSGVNLDRFQHAPLRKKSDRVRIVCVARLIREKGVFDVVEAARIIVSKGRNVEFIFCGSPDHGNRTSVDEATLAEWKRHSSLSFAGHVDDVHVELAAADIVTLPSYREGTPRSLLEAAAIGRPIVTTDVPGCRETVDDQVTGFLVPSQDPQSLAEALLKLIDDGDLRIRMGNAGRQKAVKQFDERIVIHRTLSVYDQLLGQTATVSFGTES